MHWLVSRASILELTWPVRWPIEFCRNFLLNAANPHASSLDSPTKRKAKGKFSEGQPIHHPISYNLLGFPWEFVQTQVQSVHLDEDKTIERELELTSNNPELASGIFKSGFNLGRQSAHVVVCWKLFETRPSEMIRSWEPSSHGVTS